MDQQRSETTQDHLHKISRLTLVIALFALVLLVGLYAIMKSQKTTENTVNQNTNITVSSEQLSAMNARYAEEVSDLVAQYIKGTMSAQNVGLELEHLSVTSTYKGIHAQLSALFFNSTSDDAKKQRLRELDDQYTWLLQ